MQTAVEVFEQIRRSVRTLRKLPRVEVKNRFCNWPEVIRSFHEAYGWNDPDPPRIVPTSRQLDEMDAVIRWMGWLSQYGPEYSRIIWARAENRSWRSIAAVAGLSPETCRWRFREGVFAIVMALDKNNIK